MPTMPIDDWIEFLEQFYNQYGYLVVFLGTLGENTALLGFLLPGNLLALLAAFYARQGTLNLGWVIFLASLGTVLGYHIDYLLGRFMLTRISLKWGTSKLGRRMRLAGRLRLARMLLTRHGGKAILISHVIGQMRSITALSAGMIRMNYVRFLLYELVAASLWNTVFSFLGYFIAGEIEQLQLVIERAGWVLLGLLILVFLLWRFYRRRRRERIRRERRAARSREKSGVLRGVRSGCATQEAQGILSKHCLSLLGTNVMHGIDHDTGWYFSQWKGIISSHNESIYTYALNENRDLNCGMMKRWKVANRHLTICCLKRVVSQIEQKTGTVTRGMRRREEHSVLCEIWQNRPRWLPESCRCSYENKIGEVFPV